VQELNHTLKMPSFRVVDARDGSVLKRASITEGVAQQAADKLIKKGIPAVVERLDHDGR
jgi:hypothetical protein